MSKLDNMTLEELWQLFPIVLAEHNPEYAKWYDEEAQELLCLLAPYSVCRINHIGSTAVKGLLAKPTVDILLELPKDYQVDAVAEALLSNDWLLMAQNAEEKLLDFNKGYTAQGFASKVFHLHIKPSGDWGELYFRDYLLSRPDIAQQYALLKQDLMKLHEHNRDAYTNAKTEFILQHTRHAQQAYAGRYIPDG